MIRNLRPCTKMGPQRPPSQGNRTHHSLHFQHHTPTDISTDASFTSLRLVIALVTSAVFPD